MKFTINLATRRYLNKRRLNGSLIVSLSVLALLLVVGVREAANNQAELSRIRNQNATAASRAGGAEVGEAQLKSQAARIAFANDLIDRKTFNWLGLLDRLEEVVPSGVALTSVQPDPHQRQLVKIGGTTRSFTSLRALLENMERSRNFSEVYLLSQNIAKVGKAQQGVTFSITCRVIYQ